MSKYTKFIVVFLLICNIVQGNNLRKTNEDYCEKCWDECETFFHDRFCARCTKKCGTHP